MKRNTSHANEMARAVAQPHSVEARVSYLRPQAQRPFNYLHEPPEGMPWHNCEYDSHRVAVRDARLVRDRLSIDMEGFELHDAPTKVRNFEDPDEISAVYHAEVMALALAVTGGHAAHVFDHQVRKREAGRPALTFGRHGDGSQPAAVGRVHNDYTEASGLRRLGLVVRDPVAVAQARRFCIVNVWRSIRGPVLDTCWGRSSSLSAGRVRLSSSNAKKVSTSGRTWRASAASSASPGANPRSSRAWRCCPCAWPPWARSNRGSAASAAK